MRAIRSSTVVAVAVVVGVVCQGPVAGQGRVWVVDAANGPGTDFTDLPPAEAVAVDGDVIRIRAGLYNGIRTGKALALVGTGAATQISGRDFLTPALDVRGIGAGRVFSVRDLVLTRALGPVLPSLANFTDCSGVIVVQGVDGNSFIEAVGCGFTRCAAVLVGNCGGQAAGGFTVWCSASVVAVAGSTLHGQFAELHPRGSNYFSSPGLAAWDGSTVYLAGTTLTGGNGAHEWPYIGTYRPSSPGLSLNASSARIAGDCAITAGTGATPAQPVSAIAGTGSVDLDPAVPLSSFAGAPPVAPAIAVRQRPVASLTAAGGSLGGNLRLTLRSEPATPFVLAAGLAVPPLATPLGSLFLPPSGIFILAVGAQPPAGATVVDLPLPAAPLLFGQHLAMQAASADSAARVELTNPAAVVAR